jgi:hypothetical protein
MFPNHAMIGTLAYETNTDGKQTGKVSSPISSYQPSEGVKDLTARIRDDYQVAYNLQHKVFTEFNDTYLLDRADIDQKRWNAYRAPKSEDIDEEWRWNGIRPITRNRIIGIVAQMTARIVIPAPYAQNDKDELDRTAAQVMRDLMDYNIRNSNYVENYIMWITDALVNPAAYMGVGFFQAMQTIKEEDEETGKITKKDVIDGVLSGFQTFNIPLDEVMISNFYQRSLDKQRFNFRRRYIDYDEARAKAGNHPDFEFVRPGFRTIFDSETSMFYDVYDETLATLVEETTYYNRLEDCEIPYMNGIYVGDEDTEANPIKHRDSDNRPKYNFGVLGYEDISSRFFYFKSAAWKLGDDDELVIRTEQLLADATFLSTMPPTITSGVGQLSEAIVIPGKNTAFENPDAKVSPIQLGSAVTAAFNLLLKKERDASESTIDPTMTGVQTAPKTATEAALMAQNAKIALGRFGNMLACSLKRMGGLMIDVILQHQTVGEIEEITDGETVQKFKTFILPGKPGESLNKKIVFNPDMIGEEMNDEAMMSRSHEILDKEGGIDGETRLYEVNPDEWRKLKYFLTVDVEELLPLSLRQPAIQPAMNAGNGAPNSNLNTLPANSGQNYAKVG